MSAGTGGVGEARGFDPPDLAKGWCTSSLAGYRSLAEGLVPLLVREL